MSDNAFLRLPTPTLCLVTDLAVFGHDLPSLADAVSSAVDGGVNMVQVRAPELGQLEFAVLAHKIASSVRGRALVVANPSQRRISKIEGVGGLQLAETAVLTVSEVREMYCETTLVGRSVHSIAGANAARAAGADFLVLGTIFPSASHPGGEWHGTEIITKVLEETQLPVIGIGGITADNVGEVMLAGASGVAVVRSILGASDPSAAASELWEAMLVATG